MLIYVYNSLSPIRGLREISTSMCKTPLFARHVHVASPCGAMQSMSKIVPDDFVVPFRLVIIHLMA